MFRYWLSREGSAIAILVIFLAGLIYSYGFRQQSERAPFAATEATIVSFGPTSIYTGVQNADSISVNVKIRDGEIMPVRVPISLIRNCRVGDKVDAETNGRAIKIDPHSCRN